MKRQPERQAQGSLDRPCPSCKRTMRLVGRESVSPTSKADVLTFQCVCGQVIATMTDQ